MRSSNGLLLDVVLPRLGVEPLDRQLLQPVCLGPVVHSEVHEHGVLVGVQNLDIADALAHHTEVELPVVCHDSTLTEDAWDEPVRIAVLPDHPTYCRTKTHVNEPVPFLIYDANMQPDEVQTYDERSAGKGRYGLLKADAFIHTFLNNQ